MKDKIEEALREAYGYGAMGQHMDFEGVAKWLVASDPVENEMTTEKLDRLPALPGQDCFEYQYTGAQLHEIHTKMREYAEMAIRLSHTWPRLPVELECDAVLGEAFAYIETYTFNACSAKDYAEAMRQWPDDYRDWLPVYLATQPAQASEKEWHRVLFRYALSFITAEGDDDDLWFHHGGKRHSLKASITAALATSSQETASE